MDASLYAKVDVFGSVVVLHSDEIRGATLRAIAELWGNDRDGAMELLGKLAKAVDGPAAQWDEAVVDFETDSQMPYPELELDETRALQLADELRDAAGRTFSARRRADQTLTLPAQQDHRGQAA
jgi:hypothetical protein